MIMVTRIKGRCHRCDRDRVLGHVHINTGNGSQQLRQYQSGDIAPDAPFAVLACANCVDPDKGESCFSLQERAEIQRTDDVVVCYVCGRPCDGYCCCPVNEMHDYRDPLTLQRLSEDSH